jgi:putrescine aminotransferase
MIADSTSPVAAYAAHVGPSSSPRLGARGAEREFVRAKGTHLWDRDGREYLDLLAGFGAASLGHNPDVVLDALRASLAAEPPGVVAMGPRSIAGELAAELARVAHPLERCTLATGDGEASEAAIELARAATKRAAILTREGCFHAAGTSALPVEGRRYARAERGARWPEQHVVPFGDLHALERALRKHQPAALFVEPIEVEAGVILAPRGALARAAALCREHGALLVLDETATGLGRTGTLFAYQAEGVTPDVLVLGKALGGSLVPVSCVLTTPAIHDAARGMSNGAERLGPTSCGSALGCAAALATLRAIEQGGLVEAAQLKGDYLLNALRARLAGHPFVKEVRGRGLLVGIDLGPNPAGGALGRLFPGLVEGVSRRVIGQWLARRLLERGFVAAPAARQCNVLRLEPPLTVSHAELERAVAAIGAILDECAELGPLLASTATRLGEQLLAGLGV